MEGFLFIHEQGLLLKLDEDVVESRFAIATGLPSFENRAKSLTEGHGNTRLDSIRGRRRRCTNAAWSNCGLGADKQAFCNVLSIQYEHKALFGLETVSVFVIHTIGLGR